MYLSVTIVFITCCSHAVVMFRRKYHTNVSTVLIICKAFVASSVITLNSSIVIRMGLNMSRCMKYSRVFPATGNVGGF
jgi:hypothetical protein